MQTSKQQLWQVNQQLQHEKADWDVPGVYDDNAEG